MQMGTSQLKDEFGNSVPDDDSLRRNWRDRAKQMVESNRWELVSLFVIFFRKIVKVKSISIYLC